MILLVWKVDTGQVCWLVMMDTQHHMGKMDTQNHMGIGMGVIIILLGKVKIRVLKQKSLSFMESKHKPDYNS